MIHLTPYKQKAGFCGPVALRVLFAYYGANLSEEKLVRLCKTTPKVGTWHKDLVAAARSVGFLVEAKAGGTIEELKRHIAKGTPALVGWYAFDDEHYSVVYNITGKYVHMVDTESHLKERKRHLTIARFKELWFDHDNPKNRKEKTFAWYMCIFPFSDIESKKGKATLRMSHIRIRKH